MTTLTVARLPQGTFAPIQEFYDYYCSLPRFGELPRLADYLDHAPPVLQPWVAITDVIAPDHMKIRLFGTHLVQSVQFDPTGMNLDLIYADRLRANVHRMLWDAASRPCGYLCSRKMVNARGIVNEHPSIGLPIEIPTSKIRAMLTYSRAPQPTGRLEEQKDLQVIQDVHVDHWIDLGAGTPAWR